ncbi:proton myo-inositol cotransporter-like isoform X1 [Aphis gossypii]|uniref:proton myo-inositol cotransporter-like isoform X1 n=1 Tax=Aphis gossypii TaxID=80765 RepID=UPI00215900AE|nr:proton myo-inositol cotransporter-like isoform X1 [Aphis gossypii]XP_050054281.1 proton myo-inositol cotransporter-like isoform X1 [Aphis gossypii]XP_050054282.1 proton myo-inositol cotransporter-like isoform X1 [Aphis gossypii]
MDENIKNYKYGIKSTLAQCMAISGVWFLQIELGAIVMVPTIVIGALENNASKDVNEFLTMTSEEASWFASLLYLFTPLGNLLSTLLLDRLGHKKCMILTNIPCLVAHIMLYFAENIDILYASSILMALGMGFSNAPSLAYAGEVCEPKLRGALTSALNIFYYGGSITLTTLYSYNMQWRLTVLITTVFPILTIIILIATPDSPIWLLARGKHSKAHRNLSRLRGKVSYEKCENEFQEMVRYNVPSNNDEQHHKENTNIWKQLLEPEVLRPLRLMTIYFFYMNLLSGLPLLPYLVAILNTFAAPVNVEWTISFSMFLSVIGSLMAVFLIRKLGKRVLTLVTLSVCSICYILIGFIGVYWKNTESWTSWTVLILFLTTILVSSIGITPVSWTLVTEIFPAKCRNTLCCICLGVHFIINFFMTTYYPEFEFLVGFFNVFTILGIFGLFVCIYFYFCLPETENKTLQEVTVFFKNNQTPNQNIFSQFIILIRFVYQDYVNL